MAKQEVEGLSLEAQFELLGERYREVQTLLQSAQLSVADSQTTWTWIADAIGPSPGNYAPSALAAGTGQNSYFLESSRSIRIPGSSGEKADLDPILSFYEAQGWQYEVEQTSDGWIARAFGDGGLRITYEVQQNGQYNLTIYAGPYWGDTSALLHAVVDRIPDDNLGTESSLPSEFTPFPEWSDPVLTAED